MPQRPAGQACGGIGKDDPLPILQHAGPAGAQPPCRLGAHVLDTEITRGANKMESANRTGPVHYRTAAVGGVNLFYREAGPDSGPVVLLLQVVNHHHQRTWRPS